MGKSLHFFRYGAYGDSIANSLADVLACALGLGLASWLRPWASAALFVAAEVFLLAAIRDGLVLNIVMLIHPVVTIRAWQLGG